MRTITVRRLDLQFAANQITSGTNEAQTDQAIAAINLVLQREPLGLGAQLLAYREELELENTDHPTDQ